jgi:hypothetical protein
MNKKNVWGGCNGRSMGVGRGEVKVLEVVSIKVCYIHTRRQHNENHQIQLEKEGRRV